MINEQERLIILGQISTNKALIAYNKNPKKIFNKAKYSSSHTSNPTNKSSHATNAHHENSKKKKVYDPCKHCGKTNHSGKYFFKLK